jgi:hypothetical protein
MTHSRKVLLFELLRTLVGEWGFEEVHGTLEQLSQVSDDRHPGLLSSDRPRAPRSNREVNRSRRISAAEQVAKLSYLDDKREALLVIAAKFDQKKFLPNVADIREFLAMMGKESGALKDRSDGFRHLLGPLTQLSPERLEELARSNKHSGPAQLGPLSDAIRSAGAAIRNHEEESGSDPRMPVAE